MRLLHTADWHLGRVFHRVDLLDDQRAALEQLLTHAAAARPDLVVIAGDVYDRAVPPAPAVELLDEVLGRLVSDLGLPTLLIAGNHDSMPRLGFGARLLSQQQLHLVGRPSLDTPPVIVNDAHGPVYVYGVPYPEPALVRQLCQDPSIRDHQAAMQALVTQIWERHPPGARAVLVTHADVEGAVVSDSERMLSVTRGQSVAPATFAGFAYVALGHLHRPQQIGRPGIRYAGSLFPYSFSEAGDHKSATLVELGADGAPQIEILPLRSERRVRCLEGELRALLAAAVDDPRRDDYLRVTLGDRGPVVEAMSRLRELYPNTLEVDRPFLTANQGDARGRARRPEPALDELSHFAAFFEHATGEALADDAAADVRELLERLRRGEAERAIEPGGSAATGAGN
jgi:exonuclease SbcD